MIWDRVEKIEGVRRTRHFIRAIAATVADPDHYHRSAVEIAKARWKDDKDTVATIERAASTITSTTTSGLTNTAVADLVSLLGPISASSAIFSRCPVQLSFDGVTSITVPTVIASASGFAFIAQAGAVPIRQLSLSAPTLTCKKVGSGWVMTREAMEGSNAEALTRAAAAENLSLGVDSVLLDAVAADALRPAGLRSYAVTLTPTALAANVTQNDAMTKDLAALAGNVAVVAGSLANIIFIADPISAVKIGLRSERFPYEVFASSGLPAGTVMALAVNAFCIAADPSPKFSVSKVSAVHMEDATPAQITTGGATPQFASPVRSLWQTDTCAVKVTFDVDWAMRSALGVSWVTGILW